jgi:polyisoprenoid-binding protein YceI
MRDRRPTLTSLMGVAALAWATGAAGEVALVPAQSEIVFASKQMGVPVEGRFKRFDARIVLDPRRPETGNVTIAIDTGSATFGLPEPDSELPKPAWFDVSRFPQATFQSTGIRSVGEGRLEVAGTLRIKGFARDCVVPVTLTPAGATTTATGRFSVKRLDYRIGDGEWSDTSMVGNDVQVMFKFVLTGL